MKQFLSVVVLLCIFLIPSCTIAEITCDCGKPECTCFIQLGDDGIAVDGIIDLLMQQGYLHTNRIGIYDDRVCSAVREFQHDHALDESGKMDDDTLTFLIWGNRLPDHDHVEVWVPTDGGKKHHSKPSCSNMENPRKVSLENAQRLGIDACRKCNQ